MYYKLQLRYALYWKSPYEALSLWVCLNAELRTHIFNLDRRPLFFYFLFMAARSCFRRIDDQYQPLAAVAWLGFVNPTRAV
ncbi:hypothetical protein QUF80_24425 [Desulfococcaceae bacterium HSG8]|nr:hypothetical protein [Desulfococcaceae bacterium HSG8]